MTTAEANVILAEKVQKVRAALIEAGEFAKEHDLYLSMSLPKGAEGYSVGSVSYDPDSGWLSSSEEYY